MAAQISAYAYVECSAKKGDNVREVFETATRAGLANKVNAKKKLCVVL